MILRSIWISKDLITKVKEEYEITAEELQAVIKQFLNNKAHMSCKYTKDFNTAFTKSWAAFLLQMIKLNTSPGSLPRLLHEANTALVLNKGWDQLDPSYKTMSSLPAEQNGLKQHQESSANASGSVRLYSGTAVLWAKCYCQHLYMFTSETFNQSEALSWLNKVIWQC